MQNQFERLRYTHKFTAIIQVPVMVPVQCIIMLDGADVEDPDDIVNAAQRLQYSNIHHKVVMPQVNPVPRDFYAEAARAVTHADFDIETYVPDGIQKFDEDEGEMVTVPNLSPILPGEMHDYQEMYVDEDKKREFEQRQRVQQTINQKGYTAMMQPTEESPTGKSIYTIGFESNFGVPDIQLVNNFGELNEPDNRLRFAYGLIERIAELARGGGKIRNNTVINDIVPGLNIKFVNAIFDEKVYLRVIMADPNGQLEEQHMTPEYAIQYLSRGVK